MSARVAAASRLHFGLMNVPIQGLTHWPDGSPVRKYGGVGLMIDHPGIAVRVSLAHEWSASGSLADRAMRFASRVWDADPFGGWDGLEIVADGAPEHVGLGVGTALGLAVARAIKMHDVFHPWPTPELAQLIGRGERSGIGLYGFDLGGFLIDGGKADDAEAPDLFARVDFPAEWRVVLFRPDVPATWHGDRERRAFARSRPVAEAFASAAWLTRHAVEAIQPAVATADFGAFAEAVYAYNRKAGEPFAEDQGGVYGGPEVTGLVEALRGWGVAGVGQSSWGPTVFAFAPDADAANDIADRGERAFPGLANITVATGSNRGAITGFTQ